MNVPVKRGMLLRHQNRFYFVEDVQEHHSGKQRPIYHVALHDAIDGRHIQRTLDELQPLEEVGCAYHQMQYLFSKGDEHFFMDEESFEQAELHTAELQGFEPFLHEGDEFRVLFAGEIPLRLEAPDSVTLKVIDTAAPTHAMGTAANVLKEARLENKLEIRVPLFIKTGDAVRVNTRTRDYLGKAQV